MTNTGGFTSANNNGNGGGEGRSSPTHQEDGVTLNRTSIQTNRISEVTPNTMNYPQNQTLNRQAARTSMPSPRT